MILPAKFFNRDPIILAKALLGKVLCVRYKKMWLTSKIIETEAYYLKEKGSHSSLGFTEKRKALFMPAGTIYMYHIHGGHSLNISARGKGNAVLIKSGIIYVTQKTSSQMIKVMQELNPTKQQQKRSPEKLCSGQTLLCRSLNLTVAEWDQRQFDPDEFYIADVGYLPDKIIQTVRLGIPKGRDEHLHYRFIDYNYVSFCTQNPLRKKNWQEGKDYFFLAEIS